MAEEKYLKQYEKSATGNYLLRSRGTLKNVLTTSVAKVLTQEESGSVVYTNGAVAHVITLPAPIAGCNFKFICAESTAIVDIAQAAAADKFVGLILDGAGTGDEAASGDVKIRVMTTAVPGDALELVSDGVSWFVSGACDAANGVKFA